MRSDTSTPFSWVRHGRPEVPNGRGCFLIGLLLTHILTVQDKIPTHIIVTGLSGPTPPLLLVPQGRPSRRGIPCPGCPFPSGWRTSTSGSPCRQSPRDPATDSSDDVVSLPSPVRIHHRQKTRTNQALQMLNDLNLHESASISSRPATPQSEFIIPLFPLPFFLYDQQTILILFFRHGIFILG